MKRLSTSMMLGVSSLGLCLMLGTACGSKDKDKDASGSASPAGSSASKSGDSGKKASSKMDFAKAKAAYDEIYDIKNHDAEDKKLEAFKAKVGAPEKTDGDASIWHAVDAKNGDCFEFSMSPTKGSGYQNTDKAKCQ